MSGSDLVSLIAIIIAVASFIWTWQYNKRELHYTMLSQTESIFVGVEQMLATVPSAIKFHGIQVEELAEAGVTVEEFAYILSNFTAGGTYHRTEGSNTREPFKLDSYRGTLLRSPDTRRVWPVLKRCLAPSVYRDRIEATIALIEKKEKEAQNSSASGQTV